jgi:hypothetical protein
MHRAFACLPAAAAKVTTDPQTDTENETWMLQQYDT